MICSHCKKPGHSVEKCYRIIDFPDDFKFTKNKKFQVGIKSTAILGTPNAMHTVFMEGAKNPFTPEQTSHLLHLLKLGEIARAGVTISDANANMVQCAGNIFTNPIAYISYMNLSLGSLTQVPLSTFHLIPSFSHLLILCPFPYSSIFQILLELRLLMQGMLLYHLH